jgi:hypothetical protein
MTKEQLTKTVNALRNISIDFTLDYFVFKGSFIVRGIFINNPDDISKVKSLLESDILKSFKFKNSKSWYLGDEKEVVFMQLKKRIHIDIKDLEALQVDNYAEME